MVRLTDRPDMTLDVYRGRKTTIQQQRVVTSKVVISTYQIVVRDSSKFDTFFCCNAFQSKPIQCVTMYGSKYAINRIFHLFKTLLIYNNFVRNYFTQTLQ